MPDPSSDLAPPSAVAQPAERPEDDGSTRTAGGPRRDLASAGDGVAIGVRGLWKYFGHFPALRGLDVTLETGRFLTIFGPNGAGKTTLIKVLSTQIHPSEGAVSVGGCALPAQADALRRRIGVISHNTYLYQALTARENLVFYGRMYGVDDLDDRVGALLEEVGLSGRRDDRVATYSRGMQQRLSIARALLHEPDIMFLDEPYTGLDQHASRMLRGVLETLHTGRRTIVLTTHNIDQGLEMCDEVAIQVRGRMVYREPIAAIDRGAFEQTYFDHVGKDFRWDS